MGVVKLRLGFFRPHISWGTWKGKACFTIAYRRRASRHVRSWRYIWDHTSMRWENRERDGLHKYIIDDYGGLVDVTSFWSGAALWRLQHILNRSRRS